MAQDLAYLATRLLLSCANVLVYISVRQVRRDKDLVVIAGAIGLLATRDLFYTFIPVEAVLPVTDYLYILFLIAWLRVAGGRSPVAIPDMLLLFALIAAATLQQLTGIFPVSRLIYLPAMAYGTGSLIFQFYDVTTDDIGYSRAIIAVRDVVTLGIFYSQVAVFILGYDHPFTRMIVYPASYMVLTVMLLRYMDRSRIENREWIKGLNDQIENLFGFMHGVVASISDRMDPDTTLEYIVESAVRNTSADGGAVLMMEQADTVLRVRASMGVIPPPYEVPETVKRKTSMLDAYFRSQSISIGETVLGEVAMTGSPIFIRDARSDPRLPFNRNPSDITYISSMILVPLILSHRTLGVLAIVKRRESVLFSDREYRHLRTFADYATLAIEMMRTYMLVLEKREMDRELGIAAEIQRKLIPDSFPSGCGLRFAVHSRPARGVSGDYYDVFSLDDRYLAIMICDVAGKGIPAALVMVMVHIILHIVGSARRDAATTLNWINRGLAEQTEADHYATLSYLRYDITSRTLEYSNAAHHPILVHRYSSGLIERYDTEGLPAGIEVRQRYRQKLIPLAAQDIVVLYTDGITEAVNADREQYGVKRLASCITRYANQPVERIRDLLLDDIRNFVGAEPPRDDQTLVIMQAEP